MHGPGKIVLFPEHDKRFFKRLAGFQINDLRLSGFNTRLDGVSLPKKPYR
jgi:hypothetical protein